MHRGLQLLLAGSALAAAAPAKAGETVAYRYDSLGRLVRVEHSGTVNEGLSASYSYDPSDNRTYVGVSGAPAPPAPQPPPAPPSPPAPPPNRPPLLRPESFSIPRCVAGSFDLVGNDSDPDGDYPLALAEIMGSAVSLGYASIAGSTRLGWAKAARPGDYSIAYIVRDSRGATASMQALVTVTGAGTSPCP